MARDGRSADMLALGKQFPDADDIEVMARPSDPPIIAAVRRYRAEPSLLHEALRANEDINAQDHMGYTPLMLACKSRQDELADKLLAIDGIDLDLQNKRGFTALMMAASKGMVQLVEELLHRGADATLKDSGGRTVWGVAIDKQQEEVLAALHKRGLSAAGMNFPVSRMQHKKYGPRPQLGRGPGQRMRGGETAFSPERAHLYEKRK